VQRKRRDWRSLGLISLAGVAASIVGGGCANAPAGTGTGPRLAVTLRFRNAVKPEYYYYVLIRNAPDTEGVNPRNWPVPVVQAPYGGNGFATGATSDSTAPFTDFVLYGGGGQPTVSGYGVYHVLGYLHGKVDSSGSFQFENSPDTVLAPTSTANADTISFDLSLSRLRAAAGECNTAVPGDCPTARYLNINVVATTKLSFDPQNNDSQKSVDALGDQSSGFTSPTFNKAINIDTSQIGVVYQSSTSAGDPNYEPDNDTFPSLTDGAIELIAWQIQVKQ
jgi:hypothetical protein